MRVLKASDRSYYSPSGNDKAIPRPTRAGRKSPKETTTCTTHCSVCSDTKAGRKAHAYASANLSEMPTLEQLSADIRKSDREYIDYVSRLDCGQLVERIDFAFTDGAPGRMSREEMLMHVITHGTGHRGQVSAVMLLNSVPPAKDGFTTYLHEVEASDRRREHAGSSNSRGHEAYAGERRPRTS